MTLRPRATPRRQAGDDAERIVAQGLAAAGWTVLASAVRVGRDELDLVCLEPGPPQTLVFVEVRSRRSERFGAPEETIGAAKIGRTYRAAMGLLRVGRLPDGRALPRAPWRVDLVAVDRRTGTDPEPIPDHGVGAPTRLRHVRGIRPD